MFIVRRKNKIILVMVSDPRMWIGDDAHLYVRSRQDVTNIKTTDFS